MPNKQACVTLISVFVTNNVRLFLVLNLMVELFWWLRDQKKVRVGKINRKTKANLVMKQQPENSQTSLSHLEEIMAKTCFCKLRESCPDKTSGDCLKECNVYNEFMQNQS